MSPGMKSNKPVTENEVKKSISQWLELLPGVVWADRLNSGTIKYNGNWIKMCKSGTPDLYAIVADGEIAHIVFIEVKRPVGGRQSDDQKYFQEKVSGFHNVHYILATSATPVCDLINGIFYKK